MKTLLTNRDSRKTPKRAMRGKEDLYKEIIAIKIENTRLKDQVKRANTRILYLEKEITKARSNKRAASPVSNDALKRLYHDTRNLAE